LNINIQFQTQPLDYFYPCIGEAFGFEVASLFGHYTRRGRAGMSRQKKLNHWAKFLKPTAREN
jgi:hypothetical protein